MFLSPIIAEQFAEYYHEQETFSDRSERFHDTVKLVASDSTRLSLDAKIGIMEEWLKAAYSQGFEAGTKYANKQEHNDSP